MRSQNKPRNILSGFVKEERFDLLVEEYLKYPNELDSMLQKAFIDNIDQREIKGERKSSKKMDYIIFRLQENDVIDAGYTEDENRQIAKSISMS